MRSADDTLLLAAIVEFYEMGSVAQLLFNDRVDTYLAYSNQPTEFKIYLMKTEREIAELKQLARKILSSPLHKALS